MIYVEANVKQLKIINNRLNFNDKILTGEECIDFFTQHLTTENVLVKITKKHWNIVWERTYKERFIAFDEWQLIQDMK